MTGFDSGLGVGRQDGVVTLPRLLVYVPMRQRFLSFPLHASSSEGLLPGQWHGAEAVPFRLDGLKWPRGGGICLVQVEIVP